MRNFILTAMLVITNMCASATLASSKPPEVKHFFFPSEILEIPQNSGKEYKVVGIVSQITVDGYKALFTVSDKQTTIRVVFEGIIPDLMENNTPIIVWATWDGQMLTANSVLAKFTGTYLTDSALSELKSYGFPVYQ